MTPFSPPSVKSNALKNDIIFSAKNPVSGLYAQLDFTSPGGVKILYYVNSTLELAKEESSCDMNLFAYGSTLNDGRYTHWCRDITGVVVSDNYSFHTEDTLCHSSQVDSIKKSIQLHNNQQPRAFATYSALAPCEKCTPKYTKDDGFVQQWQIKAFLSPEDNHALSDHPMHLSPNHDTHKPNHHSGQTRSQPANQSPYTQASWQNYSWLVVFKDDPRGDMPLQHAVCTRILPHYNAFYSHQDNQRQLQLGFVNGLVPVTTNPNDIKGFTSLFFTEKESKGTTYRGLDVLSQAYIRWFLSSPEQRYAEKLVAPDPIRDVQAAIVPKAALHDPVQSFLWGHQRCYQLLFSFLMIGSLQALFYRYNSEQHLFPEQKTCRNSKKQKREQNRAKKKQKKMTKHQAANAINKKQPSPKGKEHQETECEAHDLSFRETGPMTHMVLFVSYLCYQIRSQLHETWAWHHARRQSNTVITPQHTPENAAALSSTSSQARSTQTTDSARDLHQPFQSPGHAARPCEQRNTTTLSSAQKKRKMDTSQDNTTINMAKETRLAVTKFFNFLCDDTSKLEPSSSPHIL